MKATEKLKATASDSDSYYPDWPYILMVILVTAGFWITDHSWSQSEYLGVVDEGEYTGSENATADRLAAVNANSSSTRLLLAFGGATCIWFRRELKLRINSPLLWSSIALVVVVYASYFWSVNRPQTLFKLIVLFCFGLCSVGVGLRFTLRQVLELICIACVCYIFVGVLAELLHRNFKPWRSDYRFVGTVHPNSNALYGAFLCLAARMYFVKDRSRLLAVSMLGIGVTCILFTKSRTTLIAFLLAALVTQIIATKRENRLLLVAGGIFATGLLAIIPLFFNSQSVGKVGNIAAMGRTEEVGSLTGRLPLWEELGTEVSKSPLLGYGYLAFWNAKKVEYLSDLFKWEIPHGHNTYIDVALDIGIIGVCFWIAWHLSGLWVSGQLFAQTRDVEFGVVFGLVVVAIVNGFAESLFKLPGFLMFTTVATFACMLNKNNTPIRLKRKKRTLLRAPSQ